MSTSAGRRQLGALAVRILGLLWLLRAVGHIPALIGMFGAKPSQFSPGDFRFVVAASLVGFLLHLMIAWLFLFKTDAVASRVFPEGESGELAVTAEDCLAVALATLGAYVAAEALPRVGEGIINFKYMRDTGSVYTSGSWMRGNWVALSGGIAQLVLGVGLFLKSRYLAAAWASFDAENAGPEVGAPSDEAP